MGLLDARGQGGRGEPAPEELSAWQREQLAEQRARAQRERDLLWRLDLSRERIRDYKARGDERSLAIQRAVADRQLSELHEVLPPREKTW
jgi:hypothetical protein